MIPSIVAKFSPYDCRTIDITISPYQSEVSLEIMMWIKYKVDKRFCGEAVMPEIIHNMNSFIQEHFHRAVYMGYVYKTKTKWVASKPLFTWVFFKCS